MKPTRRPAGLRPGAPSVTRRLLRGYAVAAALVLAVAVIAVFVPSKLPKGAPSTSGGSAAIILGATAGGLVVVGLVLYLVGLIRHRRSPLGMDGPGGAFRLQHRLLRGYAPAAVLGLVVALVVVLAPSTAPPVVSASSTTGPMAHSSSKAAATTTTVPGQVASSAGAAGTAGSAGSTVNTPGSVEPCSGQSEQVPDDPYSPPCETFSGGNGGSTWRGVSSSTITVTARLTTDQSFQQTLAELAGASLSDTNADDERTLNAIAEYFNTHFQFYGRKIVVKYFTGQGSLSNELQGYGQAEAEADAATAQSLGAFADITAESEPYATALWQDGIMGFGDPYMPESWHEQHAPYDWSAATDDTQLANDISSYADQKLCGSDAVYAGAPYNTEPRKFAGIAPENELYQVAAQQFTSTMDAHNCPVTDFEYTLDLGTESQQASNLVAQLKAGGYTTIICGCDPIFPVYLSGEAAQQNYFPEFIEIGAALVDQDYVGQLYNQQFYAHALGISPNEATVPYTQTLGYAAYEAGCQEDPSICNGQGPAFFVNVIYEQFDQMAIGLQMAGPDLTPSTFQTGMFDYPLREGPYGLWGWSSTQYTTPNDFREVCWDPSAVSAYNEQQGAYIQTSEYGAQRWTASTVPAGPPGCPIPSSS